jgi:putative nucleotidyltransferase with HDIG domain
MMKREDALAILNEFVRNQNLVKHMLAVEASMQDCAVRYEEDPDEWGIAGLLHDFDWEIHPTLESHPQDGAPLLRERGVPDKIIRCILSHADHTGVPRESMMEKALFACDEVTGLITAVALVRPSKSIHDVKVKSVRKKWKDKRFAANVIRDDIALGAQELGLELWEHVDNIITSMQRIASDLGLSGISTI